MCQQGFGVGAPVLMVNWEMKLLFQPHQIYY